MCEVCFVKMYCENGKANCESNEGIRKRPQSLFFISKQKSHVSSSMGFINYNEMFLALAFKLTEFPSCPADLI